MSFKDFLVLFVILQGTYSLIILSAIIVFGGLFWSKQKRNRFKVIGLALSHFCLIVGTSMTLWLQLYPSGHAWYFITIFGYILSDIFLLRVWINIINFNKSK